MMTGRRACFYNPRMTSVALPPEAQQRTRISIATEAVAEHWAIALSCTRTQLQEALALGPDTVEQVRQRLHLIKLRDRRAAA